MPLRSLYGREQLQLVCCFNTFSFTVKWAIFIRRCKVLVRWWQLKRLFMVRCVICKRGEHLNRLNSCTRYPCVPRGRRMCWRPAENNENHLQVVLCGEKDALCHSWHQFPPVCTWNVLQFPNQIWLEERFHVIRAIGSPAFPGRVPRSRRPKSAACARWIPYSSQ